MPFPFFLEFYSFFTKKGIFKKSIIIFKHEDLGSLVTLLRDFLPFTVL